MSTVNYNTDDINTLIEEATMISTGIEEINQGISSSYSALDSRVQRKFSDLFDSLNSTNRALQDELGDVGTYGAWLGDTLTGFETTDKHVTGLKPDIDDIGHDMQNSGPGTGDADKKDMYKINPEAISKLPPSEQEVIKQKLKELGFTDDEIKGILNGNVSVDKATLEALSTELANIAKTHPEVRTELKNLYGFDIFNEDGSINKDKLALAMIMDGKDPNDQYDLAAFLKKYGLNGAGNGTDENTPDSIIGGVDPLPGDNSENGVDVSGIKNADITGTDGLLDVADAENLDLLGDSTSLLAGSLGNTDGIVPKKGMEVKKGSVGAGLGIAGLGSLAAAAGGLAIVGKKKDEEEENEEVSEEENEIEVLESEEEEEIDEVTTGSSGIESIIAEELALSERNNAREEAKKAEEQKAFVPEAAIGEEIKPKRKNDKDRSWLYGLGIGLAGAALASDDDDDEEEEEAY